MSDPGISSGASWKPIQRRERQLLAQHLPVTELKYPSGSSRSRLAILRLNGSSKQ
jgi:hypothetical protein